MNALQIAAYALGFSVAAIAVLAWLVIALDRIAVRDVEERKKRKGRDGERRRVQSLIYCSAQDIEIAQGG